METEFCDLKNKNISAGKLAKNFERCVPLEDFKSFIEERGGDDRFLIDLLINLWDDYVMSDFKIKIGDKNVTLMVTKFDYLNELTSAISSTGLVRFFKLSAKLCSKYKNIYVEGDLIDTKKYFSDLFDKVPEKYVDFKSCIINGERGIRLEFKSKVESKCVDLICVVEDIDLGKNNYFSHFLSLLPIKDSDSENKYFLDFLASSLLKMYFAYSDAKGVSEPSEPSSRGWFSEFAAGLAENIGRALSAYSERYYSDVFRTVLFHQIKKRGIVKNTYCRKDKVILDLMESLKKIYGDQDLSSLFYANNDNDFLKCIRDIEEPEDKEKANNAITVEVGIIFRLLFLFSNEASCNKYRLNIINWFFESCNGQLFKRICDEFDGSSTESFCFKNFEMESNWALNLVAYELVGRPIMATTISAMCFFNHVDDKNFKKFFCLDKEFITIVKFVIPYWWPEINRPDKEAALGKLFSYDPKFVAIFLLVGAYLESFWAGNPLEVIENAVENKDYNVCYKYFNRLKNGGHLHSSALKKYISSIKPNSEEREILIECISEAFESQGDKDKNKSKEDKEEEKEKEFKDTAKNMVIDFLVDVNKQCFADLTKFRENSLFNVIKTKGPDLSIPKPSVPKSQDDKDKNKEDCVII